MNKKLFTIICGVLLVAFGLDSCDTPTGQGAAAGAGAGAAAGALIGHAIQEDRAREYGPPPPGGYPFATRAGGPGMYRSPYTGRIYALRGVPPGGLTRDVDTGQLFRRP